MILLGAASAPASVVCTLITVYVVIIFVAILMSWFPLAPGTPAYSFWRFLRRLTDPVLVPLRRMIPPVGGVLDLSPMIVIIGLEVVQRIICH